MDFLVFNRGQTPILAFPSVETLIMLVCSAQLPTSIKLVGKSDLRDMSENKMVWKRTRVSKIVREKHRQK